jgi:hypothetical protein
MDVLPQLQKVQSLVVEHAFTIGIGLLVAVVFAGIVWYWMSRGPAKSDVLINQARVNSADLEPPTERGPFPPSAMVGEPPSPAQVQENMEKEAEILAQMEKASAE